MPAQSSFDYATIRVVPRVDREEFINAGVILFCLERDFLAARVQLDKLRLDALCPDLDFQLVRRHLQAFPDICAGKREAGPIARLSGRERFHWLVASRSTVIQVSAVHSGLCESPDSALDGLFRQFVLLPDRAPQ
jgi:hypothetical protein